MLSRDIRLLGVVLGVFGPLLLNEFNSRIQENRTTTVVWKSRCFLFAAMSRIILIICRL